MSSDSKRSRISFEGPQSGRHLLLCGAKEHPAKLIHQKVFEEKIGRENICTNIQEALDRAAEIVRESGGKEGA